MSQDEPFAGMMNALDSRRVEAAESERRDRIKAEVRSEVLAELAAKGIRVPLPEGEVHAFGLDPGILLEVTGLRHYGVETYESCEGGPGHSYPEPAVRFHGGQAEGFRALAAMLELGLRPKELRRSWRVEDGVPVGPTWEITFSPRSEPLK